MTPQKSDAGVTSVALNLEVDVIPVSDVERAKQFYGNAWLVQEVTTRHPGRD